jgi:hypothetical protein
MIYSEQAPLEIFFRKSHPCDYKEIREGTPEWEIQADAGAYCYIYLDGSISYWFKNRRHRDDGPAIEFPNGTQEYYLNGVRHRVDGPSVVSISGYKEYHLNGNRLSKKDWLVKRKVWIAKEKAQEIKDMVI